MDNFIKSITKKADKAELEGITQLMYGLIQQTGDSDTQKDAFCCDLNVLTTLADNGNVDAQILLGLYWLSCAASKAYPPIVRAIGAWYHALKKGEPLLFENSYGEMLQEIADTYANGNEMTQDMNKAELFDLLASQYLDEPDDEL